MVLNFVKTMSDRPVSKPVILIFGKTSLVEAYISDFLPSANAF